MGCLFLRLLCPLHLPHRLPRLIRRKRQILRLSIPGHNKPRLLLLLLGLWGLAER